MTTRPRLLLRQLLLAVVAVSAGGILAVPAVAAPAPEPTRAAVIGVQPAAQSALVVLDTSGSMTAAGIAAATQAVRVYLSEVPTDVRVGLVTFSDTAQVLVPPTRDRAAVDKILPSLRATGETALYDGLMVGLKRLGPSGSRSLILLSDGADTVSKNDRKTALKAIQASGVQVGVVGFRTAESQDSVLTSLASAGGGRLLRAGSAPALTDAFRGVASPQSLAAEQPEAATMGRSVLLWTAAVFIGLLALGWLLISPLFTPAARRRAQELGGYVGSSAGTVTKNAAPSAISGQMLQLSDKLIAGRESTARSALLLERADLPLRVNEWYVLRVVAVVVTAATSWLLLQGSLLATIVALVVGGTLGVFAPAVFLRVAARRRARRFESQLPDTLTLMASSLATGFSLSQAIDAVVRDAAQPTAKEFGRALAETRIGAELEDSLDRLAHRMGSTNLEWTAMAIRIQRQVGGSLAETLRTTATTLRERESLTRHVQALSADGRLSANILIALPVGMFVYMYTVNRTYVEPLWTTGMGLVMSAFGAVTMGLGILWMRKTVEVEV